jgi:hypothetical protein
VSAISIATENGTRRGRRSIAPPAAKRPTPTSGIPSFAGECDLESAGERESLDRGDQGLPRTVAQELVEALRWPACGERLEVHPRAETAAGAGEHPRGETVVAVELLDGGDQTPREVGVDRVHRLWPVERDQQHPPTSLGQYS